VKNGTTKTVYLDRADAGKKAREFLAGARSAAEIAGRQVVLLAMARYADEHAVAQSQRSFHTLTPGGQLPFSGEVIDQLDELCAEKVPAHVLDRGRDDRERQAAERAKDREDRAWLAEQYEGLEAMSPEQRQAVLAEHEQRFGPYAGQPGSSSSASASSTRSSRPPRSPPRATTKRASLPPNRLRNRRGAAIPGAPPVRPARVGHGMRP